MYHDSRRAAAPRQAGRGLNYPFVAIPTEAIDLVRSKNLRAIDSQVLAILLRYRKQFRHSCWTTIPKLAELVGRSNSTVQRALRRLIATGLIRHEPVPIPDPDEPRNRTGWRFFFAFMDEGHASHAPAHARDLGVKSDTPPVAVLTPPRSQKCDPPGVTFDTQYKSETSVPLPGDKKQTTTDPAVVVDSSSIEEDQQTADQAGERINDLICMAESQFDGEENVEALVRELVREVGYDWTDKVLLEAIAQEARGWGFVVTLIRKWKVNRAPTHSEAFLREHKASMAAAARKAEQERAERQRAEEAARIASMSPCERVRTTVDRLRTVRSQGVAFVWDESTGMFNPVRTHPGVDMGCLAALEPFRDEVRLILNEERAQPGWENPVWFLRRPAPAQYVQAPPVKAPVAPPAAPPDPPADDDALTPGQEEMLEALSVDHCHVLMEVLTAAKRRQILAPHARGFDRLLLKTQIAEIEAARRPRARGPSSES